MRSLIQAPARTLVAIAAWWLEESVPEQRLHRWMVTTAARFARRQQQGMLAPEAWADVEQADCLLRSCAGADWWRFEPRVPGAENQCRTAVSAAAARPTLPAGACDQRYLSRRVIDRGLVALDAGPRLDRLAGSRDPNIVSAVDDNAERLLRHVETRRRQALSEFVDTTQNRVRLDRTRRWMQRHDVAIFFCRHARRKHDIRFLNAALKLNDWAFRSRQRRLLSPRTARYLLALAEQEASYHDWSRACELPFCLRLPAASTRAS